MTRLPRRKRRCERPRGPPAARSPTWPASRTSGSTTRCGRWRTARSRAAGVLAANEEDVRAAQADGIGGALLDRLRLDAARLEAIAGQLHALADVPFEPASGRSGSCPAGCCSPSAAGRWA